MVNKLMALTIKVCKMSDEEVDNRINELRTIIDLGLDDLDIKLEAMIITARLVEEKNIITDELENSKEEIS